MASRFFWHLEDCVDINHVTLMYTRIYQNGILNIFLMKYELYIWKIVSKLSNKFDNWYSKLGQNTDWIQTITITQRRIDAGDFSKQSLLFRRKVHISMLRKTGVGHPTETQFWQLNFRSSHSIRKPHQSVQSKTSWTRQTFVMYRPIKIKKWKLRNTPKTGARNQGSSILIPWINSLEK